MSPAPLNPTLDPNLVGRLQLHLRTRIERLQRTGDTHAEAQARLRLAAISRQLHQPSEALTQIQAILKLHTEAAEWLACADVLMTCAEFLLHLGHADDAQASLEEARRLYLGERDVTGLALSEILQADLDLRGGQDEKAHACLMRAMNGLTALQLPGPLGHVWIQLALFHHNRGEHTIEDAALSAAIDCLHLDEKPLQAALCQIQRAVRFGQQGQRGVALSMLDDVPRLLQGATEGRARIEIRAALERARFLDPENDRDLALKLLRKASLRLGEVGDTDLTVGVFDALGSLLSARAQNRGDLGEAELAMGRAIDIYIEQKDPRSVLASAQKLVQAGQRVGDLKLARRWAKRSADAAKHLVDPADI